MWQGKMYKVDELNGVPNRQGGIAYDKDALSGFRKRDYLRGLNGHCEFASANTLRNSVKMAINMDSEHDRFKMELKGGYFANTTYN